MLVASVADKAFVEVSSLMNSYLLLTFGDMGQMDFEVAAKLSGSRFMVLSGALIRLHRALAQFMLDTHVDQNGLTEAWTPVLVRDEAMVGTGQLPKFSEDVHIWNWSRLTMNSYRASSSIPE